MNGLKVKNYWLFKTYHLDTPYFPSYTNYTIDLCLLYITWTTERDGWVRLFGSWYGIHWKHKSNMMCFSERYGYAKYITLFNYRWKILKPAFKNKVCKPTE